MNAIKDGNHIRIYDAFLIKESIKEIPGRFYDPDDKAWLVPLSQRTQPRWRCSVWNLRTT